MIVWRQRRRPPVTIAALFVTLSIASPVFADDPDRGDGFDVTLDVAPCVRADANRVRRLFELELGTSHAEAAAAARGARVEIDCDGELVRLSVHDPLTGKSLTRRIDPGPPAGRDRLIALAVLELLVASWSELETTPDPVGRPAGDRADPEAESSAREIVRRRIPRPSWRTSLLLIGGTRVSGELHHGGGVRLTRRNRNGWSYSADLTGRRATDELEPGEVTMSSAAMSLSVGLYRRRNLVSLSVGAGLRGALVSLDGDAGDRPDVTAGQVTGFAGGPMARAGIRLGRRRGFTAGLSFEIGYHLFEVRGLVDGQRETGAEGSWMTGNLEAGWTF